MVTAYTSRALHKLIADYDGRVNVAQAEFPEAAQYIRALSCRKVLDKHNVESDILLRQSEYETSPVGRFFCPFNAERCADTKRISAVQWT